MKLNHPLSAFIALALLAVGSYGEAQAASNPNKNRACSTTTKVANSACLYDSLNSYWIANGKCTNELDNQDRVACLKEANDELQAAGESCSEQRDARAELCDKFGEAPYDPKFEPSQFVNPLDIGGSVNPNPWFPLIPGREMQYKSTSEDVYVTFTKQVKLIDGVPCLVVLDRVEVNGALAESTVDWFAQDLQGNVWYCGESTAEYVDGLPVDVHGSFQADVDGARPGLIAKAAPAIGDIYRQEFDLGNAEDAAEVLSLSGSATALYTSCTNTCLVTRETTPLEPSLLEHKYYKPGVGFIFQIKPATGEKLELVKVTNH
jgi:hypothetical protein